MCSSPSPVFPDGNTEKKSDIFSATKMEITQFRGSTGNALSDEKAGYSTRMLLLLSERSVRTASRLTADVVPSETAPGADGVCCPEPAAGAVTQEKNANIHTHTENAKRTDL